MRDITTNEILSHEVYCAREDFSMCRVVDAVERLERLAKRLEITFSKEIITNILVGRTYLKYSLEDEILSVENEDKVIRSMCNEEGFMMLDANWVGEKLKRELYESAFTVNTGELLHKLYYIKADSSEAQALIKHFSKEIFSDGDWKRLFSPTNREKMEQTIKELDVLNTFFGTNFNTSPHDQMHSDWIPCEYYGNTAFVLEYMTDEEISMQTCCSINEFRYGDHQFSGLVSPDGRIYLDNAVSFVHINNLEPAALRDGWTKDQCVRMSGGYWCIYEDITINQLYTILLWHERFGLEELNVESTYENTTVSDVYAAIKNRSATGLNLSSDIITILEENGVIEGSKSRFGTKYNNLLDLRGNSKTRVPPFLVLGSDECEKIYNTGVSNLENFDVTCSFRGNESLENKPIILRTSPTSPMSGILPSKKLGCVLLEELNKEIVSIIREAKDATDFPKDWGFGFALGVQEYIESDFGGVVYNLHPLTGSIGLHGEGVKGDSRKYNIGVEVGVCVKELLTKSQLDYLTEAFECMGFPPCVLEFVVDKRGQVIITQKKRARVSSMTSRKYYSNLYQMGKISKKQLDTLSPKSELNSFKTNRTPLLEGLNLSVSESVEVNSRNIFIGNNIEPSQIKDYDGVIVTNPSLFNHTADLCREYGIPSIAVENLPHLEGRVVFAPDGNLYTSQQ